MEAEKALRAAPRQAQFDNIKALLMLCIVTVHMLEPITAGNIFYRLLIVMHSFTMPCFVWVSGRFAKWNLRSLLRRLLLPYLAFQTLYLLFSNCILGVPKSYQYHMPYWLLWYLMAMMQWSLTIPLLQRLRGKWRWVFLGGTVALSLLAGCFSGISYDWNLGRFFYYYPFFCLGYFSKKHSLEAPLQWRLACLIGAALAALGLLLLPLSLHVEWWYGALPYVNAAANYTPLHRLGLYGLAALLGACVLLWTPKRRLPISTLGKNVSAVYYGHGFVVKLVGLGGLYACFPSLRSKGLFCLGAAVLTLLVFGGLLPLASSALRPKAMASTLSKRTGA